MTLLTIPNIKTLNDVIALITILLQYNLITLKVKTHESDADYHRCDEKLHNPRYALLYLQSYDKGNLLIECPKDARSTRQLLTKYRYENNKIIGYWNALRGCSVDRPYIR